jgi:Dolichyl-phosphate-mannose-protein mannosyltransferase
VRLIMTTAEATTSTLRGPRLGYRVAVGIILSGLLALLLWNVFHYEWIHGYDAFALKKYVKALDQHHLPTPAYTDVWHNPPLFFLIAAGLQAIALRLGAGGDPYKAVQLLSVAATVLTCLFAFLTARELWPRSRTAQVGALVLAAATPVLVRSGALYHPEPLAACLVAGATYALVRSFARGHLTARTGVVTGVLLGLGNLTRTWALAAFAAAALTLALAWWWHRDRRILRFGAAGLVAAGCLMAPWLVYKAARFGSPIAYSQPDTYQWSNRGRPLAFYTSLDLSQVYTHPYSDFMRNRLLPVTYTDWWGDYWRYWDVPTSMVNTPPVLPRRFDRERVYQSYVGVLPTLLLGFGLIGVGVLGVRRRSPALVFLAASVIALFISYAGFLIAYPKHDGDNMKSLYLLNAAMPLAVCGGWALTQVRRLNRLTQAVLALIAIDLLYLTFQFLTLP